MGGGENIDNMYIEVNLVGNKVKAFRREGKGEEVEGSYVHGILQGWVVSVNRRRLESVNKE